MTLGITLSLTIYALTTKSDFTMMGGTLFVCSIGLFLFGFGALFFGGLTPIVNVIYCTFGVVLYGIYLVYDVQLLVGGHTYQLSLDDYVVGSI